MSVITQTATPYAELLVLLARVEFSQAGFAFLPYDMRSHPNLRLWLSLMVGVVVAVILIHPAVDLAHGIAPNSAPSGPVLSRKHAITFSLASGVAFTLSCDVFTLSAAQPVSAINNARLDTEFSRHNLSSQLSLRC